MVTGSRHSLRDDSYKPSEILTTCGYFVLFGLNITFYYTTFSGVLCVGVGHCETEGYSCNKPLKPAIDPATITSAVSVFEPQ